MSSGNFKDEDRINALRERLYSRGQEPKKADSFTLTDTPKEVQESWQTPPGKTEQRPQRSSDKKSLADRLAMFAPKKSNIASPLSVSEDETMTYTKPSRRYRKIIVLAGLLFFVLAVGISSLFFFFGNNTISGENISVTLSGPFTIGGGEAIPLQVGVTNQNAVPIESATLIVTYPPGTQSATEEGKELFVERLPLDTVEPGETLNVPLRAIVFGEENEEKEISVLVEYRVTGSNSIFERKAEPLRFKISSSPVVMSVQAVQKVSSGQETDIVLEVRSNAPNPLTDILVKADYPVGFEYYSSDPEPVSGKNVWLIEKLDPEESTKITVTGVVVGRETDEYAMHFSIGVGTEGNRLDLSSVLSTVSTEFEIEQPFIDVQIALNGDGGETVAVVAKEPIRADIVINNTLEDTIYDGRIELKLSGNALSDYEVDAGDGFYDSQNNTVIWEPSSLSSLREIRPGGTAQVGVSLRPDPDIDKTPQLAFDVDVRARRVTEGNVTEELIGTAQAAAKVSSVANLLSEVSRGTSIFTESGPLPPVAEEATTYTVTLFAENGSNDVGDAEVTATLPIYVTWLDKTSGAGDITYNEVSRTVTWDIGSIDANQSKIAAFHVSLLPSISQIGTTPTVISDQRFRATDRFTGSVVRTSNGALTTRLSSEAGYPEDIGTVRDVGGGSDD